MFSYAVASACYEYKLTHKEQFVVLTREKLPSIHTKGKVLKALNDKLKLSDDQISGLFKTNNDVCWGEDKFL